MDVNCAVILVATWVVDLKALPLCMGTDRLIISLTNGVIDVIGSGTIDGGKSIIGDG
jgi:hypothetical protein